MTQATDYYRVLDVDDSASAEAIKHAYRRLARTCHPDHHPGDAVAEEQFKSLQSAYEVLVDASRRAAYDRSRRRPFGQTPEARAARSDVFSFFFDDPAPRQVRGQDVEAQLQLTFDQALRGGTTDLPVHSGDPVRLVIPRGVRSGVKIRVSGRGQTAPGGTPGDLYVTLRVDASPRFRREGDHLHIVETISAVEAMLGTSRSITNPYGQTIKVTIPAGTQPGERLRLRGQGVATPKRTGDLFVEVHVMVPRRADGRAARRARAHRAGDRPALSAVGRLPVHHRDADA